MYYIYVVWHSSFILPNSSNVYVIRYIRLKTARQSQNATVHANLILFHIGFLICIAILTRASIHGNMSTDITSIPLQIISTHGSHFFRLTNFPDFSIIFCSFPVFFKFLFYLKYGNIFTGVFAITG